MDGMKTPILGIVTVVTALLCQSPQTGTAAAQSSSTAPPPDELSHVLAQVASKLNEAMPMMVDKETRLDNVLGLGSNLTYNYTIVNYDAKDLDFAILKEKLERTMINKTCTSKFRNLIDWGVTAVYSYSGKDGIVIGEIRVAPSDCKALQ
jgi:hypothetical protein